jgi:hypothetical protein
MDTHDVSQPPSLWRQAMRTKILRALTPDEIGARAYLKFCDRDTGTADAVRNWLAAERELVEERIAPRGSGFHGIGAGAESGSLSGS